MANENRTERYAIFEAGPVDGTPINAPRVPSRLMDNVPQPRRAFDDNSEQPLSAPKVAVPVCEL